MPAHTDIRRTLLLLVKDGSVLLAMKKRGFGEGKWNGVGGKVEPGETIEQATIRECQEEITVTPHRITLRAELDFIQTADTPEPWHMYGYVYTCTEWAGEPQETDEMKPQWFAFHDIPYKEMWDDDELWLPLVLNGDKIQATFTFDQTDALLTHHVEIVEELPYENA